MHVPMIMHWPGVIPKGKVVHEIGSHLDILPTIAKAAGEDAFFLADLDADPGEKVNLRRQNPAMVDELATLPQKWTEDVKKW